MKWKISFIEQENLLEISALHQKIFPETPCWPPSFLEEICQSGLGLLIKEKNSEKIQGFLLIQVVHEEAEILTFGIQKTTRRKGLGKRLLRIAKFILRKKKVQKIFLDVSERNLEAFHLYEKLGFSIIGRREKYYNKKIDNKFFDAIVMLCNL